MCNPRVIQDKDLVSPLGIWVCGQRTVKSRSVSEGPTVIDRPVRVNQKFLKYPERECLTLNRKLRRGRLRGVSRDCVGGVESGEEWIMDPQKENNRLKRLILSITSPSESRNTATRNKNIKQDKMKQKRGLLSVARIQKRSVAPYSSKLTTTSRPCFPIGCYTLE